MQEEMKIYTRKGDAGYTSLIGEKNVSKASLRVEAYGSVDELYSFVGNLYENCDDILCSEFLLKLMTKIFLLSSNIAISPNATEDINIKSISADDVLMLEKEIDRLTYLLPDLAAFILPIGGLGAASAHICRTVSRRVERVVMRLSAIEPVQPEILKFINRLSDYFFVIARFLAQKNGCGDIHWKAE